MELILRLKDESKLEALLAELRRFTKTEGVEISVESLQRLPIVETSESSVDWEKWDEILSRDKRLPGQPEMLPQEEEEWIAAQIKEMRSEERAQHKTHSAL
ncbi:MAG: hypothetical protein JNK38_10995 [Acidobacteria bacterium]|nr:hypothetical protein [Acidobacteriota bacterium]